MAATIDGAKGARWSGADWVARNAFEFLLPALRGVGLGEAAARLTPSPDGTPPPATDLGDLLDAPHYSALWERAVAGALAAVDAEAGRGWAEPDRFPEFRAAVAALSELALQDGNALVVRLAERVKNFSDTP